MEIVELNALTERQLADVRALMVELDPEIPVADAKILATVNAPSSHFFAAVDPERGILGCASLCVFYSPTGTKASIEDVVVSSSARGAHLGRRLLEHLLEYARTQLGDVDIHLTSRPQRVAANALYQSLGFERRETNAYVMKIRTQ